MNMILGKLVVDLTDAMKKAKKEGMNEVRVHFGDDGEEYREVCNGYGYIRCDLDIKGMYGLRGDAWLSSMKAKAYSLSGVGHTRAEKYLNNIQNVFSRFDDVLPIDLPLTLPGMGVVGVINGKRVAIDDDESIYWGSDEPGIPSFIIRGDIYKCISRIRAYLMDNNITCELKLRVDKIGGELGLFSDRIIILYALGKMPDFVPVPPYEYTPEDGDTNEEPQEELEDKYKDMSDEMTVKLYLAGQCIDAEDNGKGGLNFSLPYDKKDIARNIGAIWSPRYYRWYISANRIKSAADKIRKMEAV